MDGGGLLGLALGQVSHHGAVKGQAAAEGVHHKTGSTVVPEDHAGVIVKGEDQHLLVFGAAELAQLLPAGKGGEEGLAVLIGEQLELDGSAGAQGLL